MNAKRQIIKHQVKDALDAIRNFSKKLDDIWEALEECDNHFVADMVASARTSWTNGTKTLEYAVETIAITAYELSDENKTLKETVAKSKHAEDYEEVMRLVKRVKGLLDTNEMLIRACNERDEDAEVYEDED